jgi:hypothetical protein
LFEIFRKPKLILPSCFYFYFHFHFLFCSVCLLSQAARGALHLMLGSVLNINKEKDQNAANIWNNVVLAMGIVTTVVNVIISSFDMKQTSLMGFSGNTRSASSNQ